MLIAFKYNKYWDLAVAWLSALSLPLTVKFRVLSRLARVGFVVASEAIEKISHDVLPFIVVSLNPLVFHDEF